MPQLIIKIIKQEERGLSMKGQFSAASPARTVDRRKKQRRRINMWCWIFMIPTLILYILFQGYPDTLQYFLFDSGLVGE